MLQELRELLGEDVILLPCAKGEKRPSISWKLASLEWMSDPAHLARLGSAFNFAVIVGPTSGHLV